MRLIGIVQNSSSGLLLLIAPLTLLLGTPTAAEPAQAANTIIVVNRAPLQPNAFNPLPLGSVRPAGWLKRQEEIQAAGLTGHLDEFWSDVEPNSGWLGGTGESWERGPYYLDGLLPLAYQLDDPKLIAKARRWVEWTLNSQTPEGQFGPAKNDDWWPRMVMLKVLTQYAEVTADPRVVPFMAKYFEFELRHLPSRPLRDWGKYRWQDNAYSVIWLYNRTDAPDLLSLVRLLHQQGYNWEEQFNNFTYTTKQTKESLDLNSSQNSIPEIAMQTHGVNNAMALKAAPIWWLMTGAASDRSAWTRQLAMLDRYHGLPNGLFSADEHLAGINPSQGTELCTVVESMFSYEEAFAVLGDSQIADRLERVTYNALPATLSDDMWSHQYDQQPNQIACTRAHRQWSTNGPDSNLFGLEPNFGCCTANLHQGWPKFVTNLWMALEDKGLVTVAYAPNEVHANLGGAKVTIREETSYPFQGDVRLTVNLASPATFPIVLRIPDWAQVAVIKVNGQPAVASSSYHLPGGFFPISRNWGNGDIVTLSLPLEPRVTHWYHNSVVFERGPLVFALPLDGAWTELKHYAEKSGDWQIESSKPWNYGLQAGDCAAVVEEHPIANVPFDAAHPAVSLKVHGKRLPAWNAEDNSAGPLPLSPVAGGTSVESLTLIPYGAAKVRITAFPFLDQPSHCDSTASQ